MNLIPGNTTIANGADVAQGSTTDAIAAAPFTAAQTEIALLKYLANREATRDGYPVGATPFSITQSAAAAVNTVTMPAVAGKTNYITGIEVTGLGATAANVATAFITQVGLGSASAAWTFGVPAGANVGIVPTIITFDPPLKATLPNTAFTLTIPSFGPGNINTTGNIRGFVL